MKKTNTKENNEIIEIPAEEAPYALPDGWKWVRLEQISEIIMGQSPSGDSTTDDPSFLPLIGGAADMGAVYPKISRYTKIPTKISKKDDLILCVRATLGRPIFSDGEYCLGRGVAAVRSNLLVKEYLRYFFISFEQYFYDNATGSTFAQISSEILKKMPIPLPPLETQKRIVDRIESLFAKLDEAKEKAQTALDTFELRKSAILHKAFTGELTAHWRSLNSTNEIINELTHIGVAPAEHSDVSFQKNCKSSINLLNSNWEQTCLKNIVTSIKYGCSEKSEYEYKGIPVLRIPNIGDNGSVDFTDLKNLISNKIDSENLICENDILIIRSNGSRELVGKCALVPKLNRQYAYASFLIRIRISKNVYPKYLVSYLNSSDARFQLFSKAKSSSGIHNINSKELGAVKLSIPPLPEQQEIVRILDDLLAKENAAKEAAEAVIEKIDLMKKSILARAFRGEL